MSYAPESFKDLRENERAALAELAAMPDEELQAIIAFGRMDPVHRDALLQNARNTVAIQNIAARLLHWKSIGTAVALFYAWWTGILGAVVSYLAGNPAAAAVAAVVGWEVLT